VYNSFLERCRLVLGSFFICYLDRVITDTRLTPRKLFLFDLAGALLSAFLLGIILPIWQPVFGIPVGALRFLAAFPLGFALFDLYSLRQPPVRQRRLLRVIAVLNGGYCLLSLGVGWAHRGELTGLGWGYLVSEILLVLGVAALEWRSATSVAT
jgi:hypothetical protein